MNTFLEATRRQLRFATAKGAINTEDLWQLSLKSLDQIALSIDARIQPQKKSFLDNPDAKASREQADNELALEILKEVIRIKQDENRAALEASNKARQKEFLKSLIEKKRVGAMEELSIEELEAKLKETE
jgi:predicted RNA-binding Zn ribbon-like protein